MHAGKTAEKPHHNQHQEHGTEHAAEPGIAVAAMRVIAPAAAEQQHQYNDQKDQAQITLHALAGVAATSASVVS